MDLMEAIKTRRSVRSYTFEPLDRSILERLIQAAILAPSAMNAQPWAFGVIQGAETLRGYSDRIKAALLSHMTPDSPAARYRDWLDNPAFNLFYGAPALVVIYGRAGLSPARELDCALAAENLMLAARDMGLGSCFVGLSLPFFDNAEIKREFGVPEDSAAVAPIVVGHPAGETSPTPRNEPVVLFWR